jgi:hypothetical protein
VCDIAKSTVIMNIAPQSNERNNTWRRSLIRSSSSGSSAATEAAQVVAVRRRSISCSHAITSPRSASSWWARISSSDAARGRPDDMAFNDRTFCFLLFW